MAPPPPQVRLWIQSSPGSSSDAGFVCFWLRDLGALEEVCVHPKTSAPPPLRKHSMRCACPPKQTWQAMQKLKPRCEQCEQSYDRTMPTEITSGPMLPVHKTSGSHFRSLYARSYHANYECVYTKFLSSIGDRGSPCAFDLRTDDTAVCSTRESNALRELVWPLTSSICNFCGKVPPKKTVP